MILQRAAALRLQRLVADTSGATTIEYALIIFIVSLAIGFLLPLIGESVQDVFEGVTSTVNAGAAAAND